MKCPDCGRPQDMSEILVPGVVVFRCRACRTFRIGGDDQVILGGSDVMGRLRCRAHEVLAERRHEEMISSDSDDPRWESWVL